METKIAFVVLLALLVWAIDHFIFSSDCKKIRDHQMGFRDKE